MAFTSPLADVTRYAVPRRSTATHAGHDITTITTIPSLDCHSGPPARWGRAARAVPWSYIPKLRIPRLSFTRVHHARIASNHNCSTYLQDGNARYQSKIKGHPYSAALLLFWS